MNKLLIIGLLVSGAAYGHVEPIPRVGSVCPPNYVRSSGYCLPVKGAEKFKPAIPRASVLCPAGWVRNGSYCVKQK